MMNVRMLLGLAKPFVSKLTGEQVRGLVSAMQDIAAAIANPDPAVLEDAVQRYELGDVSELLTELWARYDE